MNIVDAIHCEKNKQEENKQEEREAFQALMKLIAPANQDEAIRLYVRATMAEYWRGWHSRREDELIERITGRN